MVIVLDLDSDESYSPVYRNSKIAISKEDLFKSLANSICAEPKTISACYQYLNALQQKEQDTYIQSNWPYGYTKVESSLDPTPVIQYINEFFLDELLIQSDDSKLTLSTLGKEYFRILLSQNKVNPVAE